MDRRDFIASTSSGLALGALPLAAAAQARPKDVLIVANEFGPNSLDIQTLGANRPAYGVSWLVYDRLMTYGKKTLPDGRVIYDRNKLEPELAESWQVAPDGNPVHGFLCEAHALEGATDISHHGGWRAYLATL